MSRILIAHPARLTGRLQHEFAVVVRGRGLIATKAFRKHAFVVAHRAAAAGGSSWSVAFLLGSLFPLTVLPLKPVFAQVGNGLGPALVWCVLGSAIVGGLLRWWARQEIAPR